MKLFILRLLIIGIVFLLCHYALKIEPALLIAFVVCYIIEPVITQRI